MKYTLMHKRIEVAQLDLDEATGIIRKIGEVYAQEHLPVGVAIQKGIADRTALNEWWTDRSIPASRSGIRDALETLNLTDTKMLLTRCFGLSLSDQYWIKPENSDLTWDRINFFENPFSDDIGDILFGKREKNGEFDFSSPDNTSDGCLKKCWKIIDGKRCLVKAGSNPFQQQPLNEVIASKIMERLNIPHVSYSVVWSEGLPYSICEDFVSPETDLVSAWRVMQTIKKDNSTSAYRHYVNCCEELGVNDIIHALDQMIVLDYIIANEDRHLNNFGLLRNAETLEWLGAAPIFDSGTSLGYDKLAGQIRPGINLICKPFKKHHEEQLKLVSSFDWIDFEKLNGIGDEINSVFSSSGAENYLDDARIKAITDSVQKRIDVLYGMAMKMREKIAFDDINDDVTENIAEDYAHKSNEFEESEDFINGMTME